MAWKNLCSLVSLLFLISFLGAQTPLRLRYAHPNSRESVAGLQAELFARTVGKLSGGSLLIDLYPNSVTGSLQEQAEQVASGFVALHHNTAAAFGTLFPDFALLDTPYLYKDPAHLLRVTDPSSPVMRRLTEGLAASRDVRVLGSYYFGTRHLTLNRPAFKPSDLMGLKIRSLPFALYRTTVEGLGGRPVPIDWAETPNALRNGVVDGQENPVNIIRSAELYRSQSHLILTGHIISVQFLTINGSVWNRLSAVQRRVLQDSAEISCRWATEELKAREEADLAALISSGMTLIDGRSGLDIEAFRMRTAALVKDRYDTQWAPYFAMVRGME